MLVCYARNDGVEAVGVGYIDLLVVQAAAILGFDTVFGFEEVFVRCLSSVEAVHCVIVRSMSDGRDQDSTDLLHLPLSRLQPW